MSAEISYVGDTRRLEARFFNFDEDPTDPSTVTLVYVDPSGNETITTSVTNDTSLVGKFYYDLDVDEAGRWQYSFNGSGNGVDRTEFGSFLAQAKPFE